MEDVPGFIETFSEIFAAEPLREKILAVPSQRVGRQWLDRAAATGAGFVNVRVATPRRLVLDFAEPELARRNLRVASGPERLACLGRALDRLRRERDGGHFASLAPSLELARLIHAALDDLEQAGAWRTDLAGRMESPAKAEELDAIRRAYAGELAAAGLAGPGMVERASLSALQAAERLPLLVMPASLAEELTGMERRFWIRWPAAAKKMVEDGEDGRRAAMRRFTADSAANEAREALRLVQRLGAPLDTVEIVCMDPETYAPALLAAGLETFGGTADEVPFTFNSGIPGCHAKPARLLAAWLEWLEGGLPPEGLARMLEAGLLGYGWRSAAPGLSAAELAARLRALPLGGDMPGYRAIPGVLERNKPLAAAATWLVRVLDNVVPLRSGGVEVELDAADVVLKAAERLLRVDDSSDDKLDAYARVALLDLIAEWRPHSGWPGFNARDWLAGLVRDLRVMGMGPMPGRLHIGDARSGGHSGREYTFIMGLDDSRYPGSIRQDPVLLDAERRALSSELLLSGRRRARREREFARLLARLRGTAFLSYASRSADGREQFPAGILARLAESNGEPPPDAAGAATLLPAEAEMCLTRRDDWLYAMLAGDRNRLTPADLAPWFPALAAGDRALAARRGMRFCEYDGNAPEAGRNFFALAIGGAVSPSDMERLAANPLEFFFRRVLGIRPPEDYEPVPGQWLEGNRRGTLLHDLFHDFLARLVETNETVTPESLERHAALLLRLLAEQIRAARREIPPRDELAFIREARELEEACRIFLAEEAERQKTGRPLHLEVSLGLASPHPTPWDREEPIDVPLPSGRVLRLKGRIDRIDRADDGSGLEIMDYKTGKSGDYSPSDPFRSGRHMQPLLYLHMLTEARKAAGTLEPVRDFSYFFPMPRDEGRVITYPRASLGTEGLALADRLLALLLGGRFPFTTDPADLKYSEYLAVYEASGESVAAARAKAASEQNPELEPWAALRGVER